VTDTGGALALHGTLAVVTGASRGIGRSVATALSVAGAQVVLISRSAADLERVAHEIGGAAHPLRCDVTDAADVGRAAHVVHTMLQQLADPSLVVVNNAGVFPLGSIEHTDPVRFEAAVQANLVAPFRCLHAFLPTMRAAGRGHVVTIGSVADRSIFPGNGAYSATKFGARAVHEVLREELRGSGVRTTLVSPSATDTPIWDPIDPDHVPGLPSRAAMLRPDDVADAVLWALTRPAHVNVDELRVSRS
jgi:NADP-dependent 3-hydroxy acid dehydrogenase YdfG